MQDEAEELKRQVEEAKQTALELQIKESEKTVLLKKQKRNFGIILICLVIAFLSAASFGIAPLVRNKRGNQPEEAGSTLSVDTLLPEGGRTTGGSSDIADQIRHEESQEDSLADGESEEISEEKTFEDSADHTDVPSDKNEIKTIEPYDNELVRVSTYIPNIVEDQRYSTENNIAGSAIYGFSDVWLRYGTIKKLKVAQEFLNEKGYSLKIWDGYRPPYAQQKLWDAVANPLYVTNPNTGRSSHSRGKTVDVTLVLIDGTDIEMPSDYDDFSKRGDRNYDDVSEEAKANVLCLENAMKFAGFNEYKNEWWQYTDTKQFGYDDLDNIHIPENEDALFEPDCEEFINMRIAPDNNALVIIRIRVGEQFHVLGFCGKYVRVEYNREQGYVSADYIKPAA